MGRAGPMPVPDREWIGAGSGGIYSSVGDLARFVGAILGGGANEHGRILEPETLAMMLEPSFRPDSRMPGMGLGFFLGGVDGHRVAGHDGILPGFNSAILLAPGDGVGIIALTNGSSNAFSWLQIELEHLMRRLLGTSDEAVRRDIPHHPEIWADLCGRYVLPPRIADLRGRLMLSGGAQVFVGRGRLMVRLLAPVPLPFGGLPLEPDDEHDPEVFRIDLSRFGMAPVRVVFSRDPDGRATAAHTDLGGQPWTLVRRRDAAREHRWLRPLLAVVAAGVIAASRPRRRRVERSSA
jgi:hypothetical protein